MTRVLPDISTKEVRLILILDTPNEKDIKKNKLLSSPEGSVYNGILKKSKFKNNIYYTYIDDDFVSSYFIDILRNTTRQDNGFILEEAKAKKIKTAFSGKAVFNKFMNLYKNNTFSTKLYVNEQNNTIRVTNVYVNPVEIPYTTVFGLDDIITDSSQEELLHQIDLLYSDFTNTDNVQYITNADYISIPKFIEYLDKVKQLYLDKKIEYVAFDIETNTTEWAEDWSKICLISMADNYTKYAYSCAQFHPEIWMSEFRRDFWRGFWSYLNEIYMKETNTDMIDASKDLVTKIKQFKDDLTNKFEVNSWFEDEFLDKLLVLAKSLGLKGTKKQEDEVLARKKQQIIDFSQENKDLITKIKELDQNKEHIEEEIQQLWNKLDEVLGIVPIVGQNIKFDVGFLYSKNIAKDKIHVVGDTLAEACMLTRVLDDQGLKIDLDLDSLYEKETGKQNSWKSKFKSSDRVKVLKLGTRYDNVELDRLGIYSALDSYCTLELHEIYQEKLKARIKEDGSNKLETFLMEQYNAIEMFCSGETYCWSPDIDLTRLLYERSIIDMEERFNDILNLDVVKQFLADNPEQETFKINTAGAQSHKAKILFDKRYFALDPIEAGKSGAPSTDTDKVLKPILKAAKDTLKENKPIFEYVKADKTKYQMPVTEPYKAVLESLIKFINALLEYAMWNKLKTGYIDTIWDDNRKVSIKYRPNFKIVNATYSCRLSSGMHTLPKADVTNVRDVYCSIWNHNSIRELDKDHLIGKPYNPPYGLVELEYEDGTKETKTYKDYLKAGKKAKSLKPIMGGGLFLSFDFSSLEVNVFTGMANEEALRDILNSGADLHSSMAKKVFADELKDVPVEKVKELYPHLRSFSKGATFGTLYGSSEFNLADQLNITVERAKGIIDSLMVAFPGIARYVDQCHEEAKTKGYIDTYFGVRRELDVVVTKYKSKEDAKAHGVSGRYKHALNASQNHPVQSNASVIGWICASHIQDEFIRQGMYSRVIGNVHDSVEMDIYPGELQDALRIVRYHADTVPNSIYDLLNGVKLRFDFEGGKSWGRAGEYKKVEFKEDGTTYMKFKGGNLYWKEIEEELKKAYQYEVISYEEGRDLEVNPKNPLPQPDKEVVVEFNILSKPNISEFKSKYYVGNGKLDTKRTDFVSIMDKKNG